MKFYRDLLGLELVRRSVNPDDPHTLHLFFDTANGFLTFLFMPRAHKGGYGAGGFQEVVLGVAPGSESRWEGVLKKRVSSGSSFHDPDGLRLRLESDPRLSSDQQVTVKGVVLGAASLSESRRFWARKLGVEEKESARYRLGEQFLALVEERGRAARGGYGTPHHVAFSAPLDGVRHHSLWGSGVVQRPGHRSYYFHTPSGALCELVDRERDIRCPDFVVPPGLKERAPEIKQLWNTWKEEFDL